MPSPSECQPVGFSARLAFFEMQSFPLRFWLADHTSTPS